MASPSIQPRSDTYDFITTDGHVGSCGEPSTSGQIPLALSQDQGTSDSTSRPDTVRSAIAPADHGKAAWLFLAGCFLTEGLIWGKYLHSKLTSEFRYWEYCWMCGKRKTKSMEILYCVPLMQEHSHRLSILLRCLPAILLHPPTLLHSPAQYRRRRYHYNGFSSPLRLSLTLF